MLVVPPVNHWDTTWWPEPDRFDPTRFLPGNDTAYPPFGGGRRIRIGLSFAMMEMTLAVAVLARRFRADLPPGGLPMTISTRRPE